MALALIAAAWAQPAAEPVETGAFRLGPARHWSVAASWEASPWRSRRSLPTTWDPAYPPADATGLNRADLDLTVALGGPTLRAVATLGEDRTAVPGDDVRIVSSLGWLPWFGRPDDTAVQRHGRVWLGVGHTWGDATSLQVVAGPHLGSTLDSRRQHQYAVDRNGWSMGYRSVGLEVRGRARWASNRLAIVGEPRVAIESRLNRTHEGNGIWDGSGPPPPVKADPSDELQLGFTVELQARIAGGLWLTATARGRGHTHLGDEPLQIVDAGFLGTGLRWRSP